MSHLHLTDYESVIYANSVSLAAEDLHTMFEESIIEFKINISLFTCTCKQRITH